ncbi:MAG: RNA methyltransferase [Candidatus Coatesbacteria bacterium]|nr:RNA methyltransferase [Candidatus Coatesbacteria bacterium]
MTETLRLFLPGEEAVLESLEWKRKPDKIYLVKESDISKLRSFSNFQLVSERMLRKLTELKTSSSMAAEFSWKSTNIRDFPETGKFVLFDRIQDPGNVGSMIRTCFAAGISGIFLSPECAKLANPKTFRASRGAYFFMNIHEKTNIETARDFITRHNLKVFITRKNKGKLFSLPDNSLLIMGNEAKGVSREYNSLEHDNISIPMNDDCDSLNVSVSLGIILYA